MHVGVSGVVMPGQSAEISVHVPQGQWSGGGGGGDAQVLAELRANIAEAARRMGSARASASAALQPLAAALHRADSNGPRSNLAFLSAGSAPVDAHRIRDGALVTEPLRKVPGGIDVNVIVKEDIEKARQDAEFNGVLEEADRLRADFLRYVDDLKSGSV